MNWGGPEFVLGIIAIGTLGGIMKMSIAARHGIPLSELKHGRRRGGRSDTQEVETLRAENARLTDRLEASEDRLAVLERIVTDKSYNLADEIEALRDTGRGREPKLEDRSKTI